jgi:hypothetical protein
MIFTPTRCPVDISGIGGTAEVLGFTSATVKVGASTHFQKFPVLSKQIAGCDTLPGQDYLIDVCAAVRLSHKACSLEIGEDPANLVARLTRPIRHSQAASVAHHINVATTQHALPAVAPVATSCEEVSSHNRYNALRNCILKER